MSDTTGHEPALSGAFERTGNEPELSSARPKCPTCGLSMEHIGDKWKCRRWECFRKLGAIYNGKPTKERLDTDPEWFNASAAGEQQVRQVRSGRHPMGSPLLNQPGATCGNCRHLLSFRHNKTWFKCDHPAHPRTGGTATDIRKGWAACEQWTNDTSPADGGYTGY
jgi:hypothetical protein